MRNDCDRTLKWNCMDKKQKEYFLKKHRFSKKYVDFCHEDLTSGMKKRVKSHRARMVDKMCLLCGIHQREPGSNYCKDCAKELKAEERW